MATSPVVLLRRAIKQSGLSARQYAKRVMLRDERTIRRWLASETPIPRTIVQYLENENSSQPLTPS